jgi:hypothetical protein
MNLGADLARADYSRPDRTCDIVMKGGITSGVVYPHAVCELAQSYRFKSVGGTSAGAIAAAATAAAEYGRSRAGFNRLAELPAWIGAAGNLRSLFQPRRSTQRLFAVLIAALEGGAWKAGRVAAFRHLPEALFGGAAGLGLLVIAILEWASGGAARWSSAPPWVALCWPSPAPQGRSSPAWRCRRCGRFPTTASGSARAAPAPAREERRR